MMARGDGAMLCEMSQQDDTIGLTALRASAYHRGWKRNRIGSDNTVWVRL